jgi:hypothetical protein
VRDVPARPIVNTRSDVVEGPVGKESPGATYRCGIDTRGFAVSDMRVDRIGPVETAAGKVPDNEAVAGKEMEDRRGMDPDERNRYCGRECDPELRPSPLTVEHNAASAQSA